VQGVPNRIADNPLTFAPMFWKRMGT